MPDGEVHAVAAAVERLGGGADEAVERATGNTPSTTRHRGEHGDRADEPPARPAIVHKQNRAFLHDFAPQNRGASVPDTRRAA